MMRLDIQGTNVKPTPALSEHVHRRLGFALDRMAHRIRRAEVRVTDVSGPTGGPEQQCQVRISIEPRGEVVVAERDADLYAAVTRAARRVRRVLARQIQRRRSQQRRRQIRMA